MARWVIKHEGDEIVLSYASANREEQDCGRCEPRLMGELLEWLFSPGQVDAFDIVVLDGKEYYMSPRRARA